MALFELGFRPFYLLASLFSALAILVWIGALHGMPWRAPIASIGWHQHEMLFGFALAVIAGFLLTAGRAWTGLATPVRWPLALLAAHWLAARVLMLTGPWTLTAVVDASFPFVLAAVLGRVLFGARNRRNYFAVALLVALGLADIGFYLEQAGVLQTPGKSSLTALYLITTLVVIMGGRVVPAFTANALPRAGVVRAPRLDAAALVLTLGAFIADITSLPPAVVAALAFGAALLHAIRVLRWAPLATLSEPLLWIMHLSYAWIPLGLALLAMGSLGWLPAGAATHAFGAGAVGGMIIAMLTRTALGHTGRPLRAGGPEIAAYLLVQAAVFVRVIGSLAPGAYLAWIDAAGALWSAGFLVYAWTYAPRLWLPRVDGKPG